MRGLRAPGRLEATDPQELRIKADEMDPADVLSSYTVVPDAEGLINAYRPLVTDVGADIVSIQVHVRGPDGHDRAHRQGSPAGTPQARRLTPEIKNSTIPNGCVFHQEAKHAPVPVD